MRGHEVREGEHELSRKASRGVVEESQQQQRGEGGKDSFDLPTMKKEGF